MFFVPKLTRLLQSLKAPQQKLPSNYRDFGAGREGVQFGRTPLSGSLLKGYILK